MLNQVVTVGRVYELKGNQLTLAVNSTTKNIKGKYDVYKIHYIIKDNILSNAKEYLEKGNVVGIKAHIENHNELVVEKLTFLSTKRVDA